MEIHHARTNSYLWGNADDWPTEFVHWLLRAAKIARLGVAPFQVITSLAPRHNFDCSATGGGC